MRLTGPEALNQQTNFVHLLRVSTPDTAGAGDLVQSALEVTVTHSDNSTCFTSVGSRYFFLRPPQIWVSNESVVPVPLMGQFQGAVNVLVTVPDLIGPSLIEVSPLVVK